jgi:hypothetical protein
MTWRAPVVVRAGRSWCGALCLLALLGASLLGACQLRDDLIATRLSSIADGGAPSGGSGAGANAGSSAEVCTGFVPTVSPTLNGTRQDMCAGWLARRAFSHAVCSCGDLSVLAVLASDARDSEAASTEPDRVGAAVGVNGNYAGGEYVRIGGSFTVAGAQALASRGGIDVAGDARLAGPTSAAGPIFVGRDAWLLGATSSLSLATVGRDLHLGPNGSLEALGPVVAAGATLHETFDVAPPCACEGADLVDIGGIVNDGLAGNDNARLGLELDALAGATPRVDLRLACGRFALREIAAGPTITLRIGGRVVLVVDGDVDAGRRFSLRLEPGAELDWFIRGNLSVSGESLIGDDARPGATRVYVLGTGDIAHPGTARFSANLYAPRAHVSVGPLGDVYGAVFGAEVSSLGPLLAHYDRAVLRADQQCAVPLPARCSSCDQCGAAKTCVAASCSACTADRDCCFPLVCEMGACLPTNAD